MIFSTSKWQLQDEIQWKFLLSECTSQRWVKIKNITAMDEHRLKVLKKDGKACDLIRATINTCEVKPGVSYVILACFKNIMKNSYKEISK